MLLLNGMPVQFRLPLSSPGVAILTILVAAHLPAGAHTAPASGNDYDLEFLTSEDDGVCAVSLLQRSAVVKQRSSFHQMENSTDMSVKASDEVATISSQKAAVFGSVMEFLEVWQPYFAKGMRDGLPAKFVNVAMIVTWCFCAFYTVCAIWDISKLWRLSRRPKDEKVELIKDEDAQWSSLGIWMLCFYRLYTGFLAATWLPYVLAMEGEYFWPNNQSLFMGIAKLIYGIAVLMNPMFGLIGDMLAEHCQGAARRLWILLGITLSAFGIMICLWAGPRLYFLTYMFGITVWRVGESLNDVTTEAIVPELVPTRQFALASSIKAASFLVGGLLGYCALFFMADVHYTWCYFAYLGSMFICAIPSLVLLINDKPAPPNPFRQGKSFAYNMSQAYITPCTFEGGFPQISLAIFIMSCGTAPMFFFLLIIRDLLGVHNEVTLQRDFAIGSVLFFLAAAAATIVDVTYGDRIGPSSRAQHTDAASLSELSPRSRAESVAGAKSWEKEKIRRIKVLVWISAIYALSVLVLPLVQFAHSLRSRFAWFYPLVVIFGATFGLGYSRFQDATWRLLPVNCDMANAMGFNVMARNFGLGVGNFCFGAMLEAFKVYHKVRKGAIMTTTTTTVALGGFQVLTTARQVYTDTGYDFMCIGCSLFNIVAGFIAYRIIFLLPDPDSIAEAG